MSAPRSLRTRLALLGTAGVLVPLAVLLVVALVSTEESRFSHTDTGELVQRTRALSPWVPFTAAVLALPAVVAAWWWAGRAVGPLQRIAAVADEIQAGSLDRRIDLDDAPVEVQALADSFDRMLERLETATELQDRLIEDTSHHLRTPIAVLAAAVDVALADADASAPELRAGLREARASVTRLEGIVGGLLADARAARHSTARRGNDLVAVVTAEVVAAGPAALVAGVDVRVRAPERLLAACDGAAVGRAVASMLDNAIAHAPSGTAVDVEVALDSSTSTATVAVTDKGAGIPPEQLHCVFERYWSDRVHGLGIGLAVVKQVGEAHEGVEVVSPLDTSGGTRFTLRFRPDLPRSDGS